MTTKKNKLSEFKSVTSLSIRKVIGEQIKTQTVLWVKLWCTPRILSIVKHILNSEMPNMGKMYALGSIKYVRQHSNANYLDSSRQSFERKLHNTQGYSNKVHKYLSMIFFSPVEWDSETRVPVKALLCGRASKFCQDYPSFWGKAVCYLQWSTCSKARWMFTKDFFSSYEFTVTLQEWT